MSKFQKLGKQRESYFKKVQYKFNNSNFPTVILICSEDEGNDKKWSFSKKNLVFAKILAFTFCFLQISVNNELGRLMVTDTYFKSNLPRQNSSISQNRWRILNVLTTNNWLFNDISLSLLILENKNWKKKFA